MKNLIISISLVLLPLFLLSSNACPDCVSNLDITDKQSVLTCAITVVFGLVVRYIEKRKSRRRRNDSNNFKY